MGTCPCTARSARAAFSMPLPRFHKMDNAVRHSDHSQRASRNKYKQQHTGPRTVKTQSPEDKVQRSGLAPNWWGVGTPAEDRQPAVFGPGTARRLPSVATLLPKIPPNWFCGAKNGAT